MRTRGLLVSLIMVSLMLASLSLPVAGGSVVPDRLLAAMEKVEPLVLEELVVSGDTDFFVWLTEKADLSFASQLPSKQAKGRYVFETLVETATRTQAGLRRLLDQRGVQYEPFYIANKVLVMAGDRTLLASLAARDDVAEITANHVFQLQEPFIDSMPTGDTLGVGPNVSFINADDVWAMGNTGQGTVLAGNDTGLQWDHPAIKNHYRGWSGSAADHNYDWWDATGTYDYAPGDGHGHGTHTTGTMVGDDGGTNQIGVAPGAKTIHCKNMTDSGSGNDAMFTECFQWDLAPWDLNGLNPNPDLAPDAVNNSWGYWGGNAPQFRDEITALHAAGILVEVSAGNEGSSCASLRSPGDYQEVLTTGSVSHLYAFPGRLTGFSSRGPSDLDGDYFPDIMAPGEGIRSSVPTSGYASWSGTSMAGPHATALVGLMWSACPSLAGTVEGTMDIIRDTSLPLTGQAGSNCGGDYVTGPNNDWGLGTIDAYAAVQGIMAQCSGDLPPDVSITDPNDGQQISGAYRVLVDARDDQTLVSVELEVDGSGYMEITQNFDGTYFFYDWDTMGVSDGDHTLQARATDDAAQSTESLIVNVTIDNVNDPPVAVFTVNCTDLSCSFDASDSRDPDGTIVAYAWDFGDSNTGSGVAPSHTYAGAGDYSVELTVTDNDGATGTDAQTIHVEEAPRIHAGDLDGDRATNKNKWTAYVTITVHDAAEGAVADATVTGTWSNGTSGTGACTTTSGGTCTISRGGILNRIASVDFSIDSIVHATATYDSSANHDPDGDSDGTTIRVYLEPAGNQLPVASFTYACSGQSCTFDASDSYDPDGTVVDYAWDFGDGSTGGGVTPTHEYADPGSYDVTVTVTDNEGATGDTTQSVPVGGSPGTIYVLDIAMNGKSAGPNRSATATVAIVDIDGNPAAGATVTGVWGGDDSGTATGITGTDGTVTLASGKVRKENAYFVFTVEDVVKAGWYYDASLNVETSDFIYVP